MQSSCPLCHHMGKFLFTQERFNRLFFSCDHCELRFVDRKSVLSASAEKLRYEDHQNDKRTSGYEKFLRRLISPLKDVSKESAGLDYGQGPYPMLLEILKEDGYINTKGYDPFFLPDKRVFDEKYEFITCSEVIEHITDIDQNLTLISEILKPGGLFIVSTGILWSSIDIKSWYYIQDNTHVNFFTPKSLEYIAEAFGFELKSMEDDIIIFLKK